MSLDTPRFYMWSGVKDCKNILKVGVTTSTTCEQRMKSYSNENEITDTKMFFIEEFDTSEDVFAFETELKRHLRENKCQFDMDQHGNVERFTFKKSIECVIKYFALINSQDEDELHGNDKFRISSRFMNHIRDFFISQNINFENGFTRENPIPMEC